MSAYDVNILGFGDNVVDKYQHILTMYPGGNCVNVAVYAKWFGARRSAYMGYFGNDREAEHVISALDQIGVEMVKCRQLDGPNGSSWNTIVDGDRVFLKSNNGGVRGDTPFCLDRFDLEYIRGFDLVHSGNYSFTEAELSKIREAGILVSFDFSDDSDEEYYRRVAPNVDYAFLSFSGTDDEVRARLRHVKSFGPQLVCASRGSKGCVLYDGTAFYVQPAKKLEQVVDTMGAGDSLISSFLVGFIHRCKGNMARPQAIRESLDAAMSFAADICRIEGAFGCGVPYQE